MIEKILVTSLSRTRWGLVLDGVPPVPISPLTADKGIQGMGSFISSVHRPSLSLPHLLMPVYMPFMPFR